jgi:16S rRNA (guanine527-N7)-methyltransferase
LDRPPLPGDPSGLPRLADIFHATLRAGLTDLGLDIPADQLEPLDGYVRLLLAWTQAINLTAIREPEAVARDHLLDSLSAVGILREARVRSILDLGSGGGLPGIPLAIALPDVRVLLVESVAKKARFLATAVAALGLDGRVEVAVERAEDLARPGRQRDAFDAVTVRAVAALPELIELAFPLLRVGGRLLAWKREPFTTELAAGRNAARAIGGDVDVVRVRAAGLEGHVLVAVTKRRPTPGRFPRPPAERRAKPL